MPSYLRLGQRTTAEGGAPIMWTEHEREEVAAEAFAGQTMAELVQDGLAVLGPVVMDLLGKVGNEGSGGHRHGAVGRSAAQRAASRNGRAVAGPCRAR